jgi:multicomponent Na+:H+ antiporter subunit D
MAASGSYTPNFADAMVMEPIGFIQQLVILPVALPILAGALCLMFRRYSASHPYIAAGTFFILLCSNLALLNVIYENGPVAITMGRWLPPFGITFNADMMSAIFATTTAFVAFAASLYALSDISERYRHYGFYVFFLLLISGVSGAFLTGDIFNLYVWFEVLLISSFGMLVLGGEKPQLDGALKYAYLNLIATTLFLISVAYIYGITGTLNMADIAVIMRSPGDMSTAPVMTVAMLFFFSFAMKAAAFPVNFWLPASYHTPKVIVSAVFAGLLTKVGVYALFRVLTMLMPLQTASLSPIILWVAALTCLIGGFGALAQNDTRKALGFVVISGIGAMLIGLGLGTQDGITGSIFYAVHSMIVMTALYCAFGLAGRLSGGFSLSQSRGLYDSHPFLAALTLILIFAVLGLPPFSGFWPKILLVKATLDQGQGFVTAALLLSSFITTLALGRIWAHMFWKSLSQTASSAFYDDNPRPAQNLSMTWSMLSLCFLVGAVIAMGVGGEWVLKHALLAASSLIEPSFYLNAVIGGAS